MPKYADLLNEFYEERGGADIAWVERADVLLAMLSAWLDGRWYESVHAVPSGVRGTRLTEMLTDLAIREARGGGRRVRILGQTE